MTATNVRALTGMGTGNTTSSASGQNIAKAMATPSTAPDAPTNGPTDMKPERPIEKMAAPTPQYR